MREGPIDLQHRGQVAHAHRRDVIDCPFTKQARTSRRIATHHKGGMSTSFSSRNIQSGAQTRVPRTVKIELEQRVVFLQRFDDELEVGNAIFSKHQPDNARGRVRSQLIDQVSPAPKEMTRVGTPKQPTQTPSPSQPHCVLA